jgi:hypothetical protein
VSAILGRRRLYGEGAFRYGEATGSDEAAALLPDVTDAGSRPERATWGEGSDRSDDRRLGIDEAHLAFLEPFHLAMQRAHGVARRGERSVRTAGFEIVEAFGETPLDQGTVDDDLGRESNLLALDLGFEEVAHSDADLGSH